MCKPIKLCRTNKLSIALQPNNTNSLSLNPFGEKNQNPPTLSHHQYTDIWISNPTNSLIQLLECDSPLQRKKKNQKIPTNPPTHAVPKLKLLSISSGKSTSFTFFIRSFRFSFFLFFFEDQPQQLATTLHPTTTISGWARKTNKTPKVEPNRTKVRKQSSCSSASLCYLLFCSMKWNFVVQEEDESGK